MFSVYLQLALDSLRHQKTRTILTMLAISIGITAVIVIMAAGKGVERLIMGQLDVYGSDTLYVQVKVPASKNGGGPGDTGIVITTLKDKDIDAVRHHSNVAAVYGMVTGQEAVSYEGQIKKILL